MFVGPATLLYVERWRVVWNQGLKTESASFVRLSIFYKLLLSNIFYQMVLSYHRFGKAFKNSSWSVMTWGSGGMWVGWEAGSRGRGIYVCTQLIHVVQQELTQHCKAIVL